MKININKLIKFNAKSGIELFPIGMLAIWLAAVCIIPGTQLQAQTVLVNDLNPASGTVNSLIQLRGSFTDVTLNQIKVSFKSINQGTITEAEPEYLHGNTRLSVRVPQELPIGVYEIEIGLVGDEALFTAAKTFTLIEGGGTFGSPDTTGLIIAKDFNIPFNIMVGDLGRDGLDEVLIMSDGGNKLSYIQHRYAGFGVGISSPTDIRLSNGFIHGELADLDNDGDLDLVFTSLNSDIRWLESRMRSYGTFKDEVVITQLTDARMIKTGDLDGDGHLDIVVSSLSGKVQWQRNIDGTAEFGEPVEILSLDSDARVQDLLVDDFDNDGDLDVVSKTSSGFSSGELRFHENDGSGTFSEAVYLMRDSEDIRSADINGDGQIELVAALKDSGRLNKDRISAFTYNSESNSFEEQVLTSSIVANSTNFSLADLDSDGDLDIVLTEYFGSTIASVINLDGKGTFSEPFILDDQFPRPENVLTSDFDLDGDLDVVSVSSETGELKWYKNYDLPEFKLTNAYPRTLRGGDTLFIQGIGFNGNNLDNGITFTHIDSLQVVSTDANSVFGKVDNYRLSVILPEDIKSGYHSVQVTNKIYGSSDMLYGFVNVIEGDFEFQDTEKPEYVFFDKNIQNVLAIEMADVNADGSMEVVMLADSGLFVTFHPNSKHPTSEPVQIYEFASPFNPGEEQILIHDSDADGDFDILVSRNYGDNPGIYWFENTDGEGSFSSEPVIYNADDEFYINDITIADVDNDGFRDLVETSVNRDTYNAKIFWFRNNPDSVYGAANVLLERQNNSIFWPISLMTDIDLDGDDDLFTTLDGSSNVHFYENEGEENFISRDEYVTGKSIRKMKLFDVDVDGHKDILFLTTEKYNDNEVWKSLELSIQGLSDGLGLFIIDRSVLDLPYGRQNSIGDALVADVDADGDEDLLLASSHDIKLFRNNYEGPSNILPDLYMNEEMSFYTEAGITHKLSAITDVDGDGDQDLVVAVNYTEGASLVWFQNQGIITAIDDKQREGKPVQYTLRPNYPNPFNPATQISYTLADAARLNLSVYNALGQKVAELVNAHKAAGQYTVRFEASGLSSGVYFYRIETAEFTQTRKMLLIK